MEEGGREEDALLFKYSCFHSQHFFWTFYASRCFIEDIIESECLRIRFSYTCLKIDIAFGSHFPLVFPPVAAFFFFIFVLGIVVL